MIFYRNFDFWSQNEDWCVKRKIESAGVQTRLSCNALFVNIFLVFIQVSTLPTSFNKDVLSKEGFPIIRLPDRTRFKIS